MKYGTSTHGCFEEAPSPCCCWFVVVKVVYSYQCRYSMYIQFFSPIVAQLSHRFAMSNMNNNATRPRPIHLPGREIRSVPDDNEPSYSYEEKSFLAAGKEQDVEDEFHRRLHGSRHSGGSFWRTASNSSAGEPAFSSMNMKRSESVVDRQKSTGRLGVALQLHANVNGNGTVNEQAVEVSQQSVSPVYVARHGSQGSVFVCDVMRCDTDCLELSNRIEYFPDNHQWQRTVSPEHRKDPPLAPSQASSTSSLGTPASSRDNKKITKQRSRDRRNKLEAQHSDVDLGRIDDGDHVPPLLIPPTEGTLSRGSSDQSGSVLYGKTLHPPRNGVLLGKSSSLIFPTGVEVSGKDESESANIKRRKLNLLLDQCETVRFPFKKKLSLDNMKLSSSDLPLKDLLGTPLGNSLHKLSLVGNRLTAIPERLVQTLPVLKHLDLSQCDLVTLPETWHLPQLKRLNLSHNRIADFPDEVSWSERRFRLCSGRMFRKSDTFLTRTDHARRSPCTRGTQYVWQQGIRNYHSQKPKTLDQT